MRRTRPSLTAAPRPARGRDPADRGLRRERRRAGGTAASPPRTVAATAPTAPADGTCTDRAPDPSPDPKSYPAPPPQTIDTSRSYTATLTTSCGDIVIALDAAAAPVTVNNFVFLARQGFYDGLTFHRVVAGFVIQGGDPTGTGSGDAGYAFDDELPDDGYPTGSVAMANSGPNTNGSQFFIVTGDGSQLPNDYSRFGNGHLGTGRRAAHRGLRRPRRRSGRPRHPGADPADLHLQGDDHRGVGASAPPRRARTWSTTFAAFGVLARIVTSPETFGTSPRS